MHEPGPPRATSVGVPVELAPRNPDPDGTYRWAIRDAPTASTVSAGSEPTPWTGDTAPPAQVGRSTDSGAARPTAPRPTASSPTASRHAEAANTADAAEVFVRGETSRTDSPVVWLRPDVPGTYVVTLDAPDGTHRQRVRVYPDERQTVELRVPERDLPTPDDDTDTIDTLSLMWQYNERLLARDRPVRDGDDWVITARAPPGTHEFSFLVNDNPRNWHRDRVTVPGPGRPRLSITTAVESTDGDGTETTLVVTAETTPPPEMAHIDAATSADDGPISVDFLVDDRDADPALIEQIESLADGSVLRVPLRLVPDGLRIHAVPHGDRLGVMDTVRVARAAPDELVVSDPHATPRLGGVANGV